MWHIIQKRVYFALLVWLSGVSIFVHRRAAGSSVLFSRISASPPNPAKAAPGPPCAGERAGGRARGPPSAPGPAEARPELLCLQEEGVEAALADSFPPANPFHLAGALRVADRAQRLVSHKEAFSPFFSEARAALPRWMAVQMR